MSLKQLTNKNGGGARGGRIIKSIVLIIFTVLMEFSPARAQVIPPLPTYDPYSPTTTPGPTNTPFYGPTIQPPFWEVTPTPEYLGDCPTTPRDYDRELSFNYIRKCFQCIDTQPVIPTLQGGINHLEYQPTNIYGATPTPITDGPTPTPTSLPYIPLTTYQYEFDAGTTTYIPEVIPYLYGKTDVTYTNVNRWYYRTHQTEFQNLTETKYYAQFDGIFSSPGSSIFDEDDNMTVYLNGICRSNVCYLKINDGEILQLGNGQSYNIWQGVINAEVGGYVQTEVIDLEITLIPNHSSYRQFDIEVDFDSWITRATYSSIFTWDYEPIGVEPPETGYCSEWEYADEIEPGPPLLTLPDLEIWQGACTQLVPAFDWFRDSSGSYIFDINFSFPGFALCPVWVDITPFSLAGINIPFEIMYLPALTWLLDAILKL